MHTTGLNRRALLAAAAASLALTGCGFRPRGRFTVPFETVYLQMSDQSTLKWELRRHINAETNARVVDQMADADAILSIVSQSRSRVVQTYNDIGDAREYRLGWDAEHINALNIAAIAQEAGIKMLVLHGRTREQGFKGEVDYQRIAEVKASVDIPVIANGDIDSVEKAEAVLAQTGADGIMIGRAAIGNPWIFSQINDKLSGRIPQAPSKSQLIETIGEHLQLHFSFYEKEKGLKTIRKHLSGYFKRLDLCPTLLTDLYSVTDPIQLEKNVERLLQDNLD